MTLLFSQAPVKIAVIFKQLRVLIESVLKQKLENPKMSLEGKFVSMLPWKIRINIYVRYVGKLSAFLLKCIHMADAYFPTKHISYLVG